MQKLWVPFKSPSNFEGNANIKYHQKNVSKSIKTVGLSQICKGSLRLLLQLTNLSAKLLGTDKIVNNNTPVKVFKDQLSIKHIYFYIKNHQNGWSFADLQRKHKTIASINNSLSEIIRTDKKWRITHLLNFSEIDWPYLS